MFFNIFHTVINFTTKRFGILIPLHNKNSQVCYNSQTEISKNCIQLSVTSIKPLAFILKCMHFGRKKKPLFSKKYLYIHFKLM